MFFAPAVRAHHQHHLGDLLPRLLGHHFIHLAVLAHQRVPVDIQHDLDRRVFGQPLFHRRPGAVIGPGVGGVVIQGGVVDHPKAVGPEHGGHLLPHPHHVVGAVGGAVGVAGLIGVPVRLGVGLAAVGVDDEDLGPLPQIYVHPPLGQHRLVQVIARPVVEIDPLAEEILPAALPLGGHLDDAVVPLVREPGLLPVLLVLFAGGGLRVLLRVGLFGGSAESRPQQGGLTEYQPAPAGELVCPRTVPQLGRQQGHRHCRTLPRRFCPAQPARQVRRPAHAPKGRPGQSQGHPPAHSPSQSTSFALHASALLILRDPLYPTVYEWTGRGMTGHFPVRNVESYLNISVCIWPSPWGKVARRSRDG